MAAGSVRWSTSNAYRPFWTALSTPTYRLWRWLRQAYGIVAAARLALMSAHVLLVVVAADRAETIRVSLAASREGPAGLVCEYLTSCVDAVERLRGDVERTVAAIVLDLVLPDSRGLASL